MSKSGYSIPPPAYRLARAIRATSGFWVRAGNLETALLRRRLSGIEIEQPIYVGSMARSGTTIVTEMIGRHPDVAHHYYRDSIDIWTPWAWDLVASRAPVDDNPQERVHDDGLMVTTRSPEAVEEMLWMKFFDFLHDERRSNVLEADTRNPAFEKFYRDHLRKLLYTRGRSRYLTKANHITARVLYLLRLFPDARFVVPVRHPVNQIASFVKQDRLMQRKHAADRLLRNMVHMIGHFEFGPDKRCLNLDDTAAVRRIRGLWDSGRTVEGWSVYWNQVHSHILRRVDENPELARASLIVRFEDLCRDAARVIDRILEHCSLAPDGFGPVRQHYIDNLHEPTYYQPSFDDSELQLIQEITGETAGRLGYHEW
jgi:hypothetical protein